MISSCHPIKFRFAVLRFYFLVQALKEIKQSLYTRIQTATLWRQVSHTPPEVGVRARKFFITFDINFGRYLPRGTIIYGSRKCRIGASCTIAKNSGEMPKKGLKTGQNGVKYFFSPHTF